MNIILHDIPIFIPPQAPITRKAEGIDTKMIYIYIYMYSIDHIILYYIIYIILYYMILYYISCELLYPAGRDANHSGGSLSVLQQRVACWAETAQRLGHL